MQSPTKMAVVLKLIHEVLPRWRLSKKEKCGLRRPEFYQDGGCPGGMAKTVSKQGVKTENLCLGFALTLVFTFFSLSFAYFKVFAAFTFVKV